MTRAARNAALGASLFQLGIDAQIVIALRILKLSLGGREAAFEAHRMIAEKIDAAIRVNRHLTMGLMTGAVSTSQQKAVTHYRRKVRANRRRLGGVNT